MNESRNDAPDMEGYESFALRYDAGSQISPFNKFDRATVLGMRSDWRGLRVLEVGCAGGLLATQLIDAGANVTAFDLSPTLVALAGERAPSANIYVHDIRQPIPEPDGQFDVVVASLVLHYVQDWNPVFEDARRVLRPGGSLIVTTGHPLADMRLSESGDYFATELVHDVWRTDFGQPPLEVSFYRRPLEQVLHPAHAAGFTLSRLIEPRAEEQDRDAFGQKFGRVRRSPWFLAIEWLSPKTSREGQDVSET